MAEVGCHNMNTGNSASHIIPWNGGRNGEDFGGGAMYLYDILNASPLSTNEANAYVLASYIAHLY